MNPLVHGEIGWLTGQKLSARRDRWLVTAAGLLPDLDGLTILGGGDAYARWHHVLTHGLFAALVLCGTLAAFARQRAMVFGFALVAFHLHLVCDLAGSGVGWPILYLWPVHDFTLHWDGGWELQSWQNSVVGLVVTLVCLYCAIPLGRTVFELFSVKLDAAVVQTLRKRFGRT